jgi:hypothetical protein
MGNSDFDLRRKTMCSTPQARPAKRVKSENSPKPDRRPSDRASVILGFSDFGLQ